MAKQRLLGKIEGTLGDATYYRGKTANNKNADLVKTKGGVDGKKIKTGANFVRTRENMSEFGAAGAEAKGLFNAVAGVTTGCRDSQAFSRMAAAFKASISQDAINARGERVVQTALLDEDLVGIQMNSKRSLSNVVLVQLPIELNRTTGAHTLEIPALTPQRHIRGGQGATHAQITYVIAQKLSEDTTDYSPYFADSSYINLSSMVPTAPEVLTVTTEANDASPALVAFVCVKFYQELNGTKYPLNNKGYNIADLVAVDGI